MSLKKFKRRDSPYWYIRGTVCGRPVNQSTKIPHAKKAAIKEAISKLEADLIKHSIAGLGETVSFQDAAMSYKGGIAYKDQLFVERLEGYFAGKMLFEIGQRQIDAAAKALYPDCKPQTVNRQVYTPMSAIMRRAAQDGLIIWGGLRRPKSREMPRERWATPDECKAFLEHADDDLAGFFIFLLYTGARISEALGLRWDDVALSRNHISLREFKTRKIRPVAIQRDVFNILSKLNRSGEYVFKWRDRKQVYRLWNPCCKRAGILDLHPHDMRHTYATWLLLYSRKSLKVVMEMGGWKDAKSVSRYSHVSSDEILDAVEKLPRVSVKNT